VNKLGYQIFVAIALCASTLSCASANAEVKARMATEKSERDPGLLIRKARAYASIGDATRAEDYLNAARESGGDERVIVRALLDVCISDHRYRAAVGYAEDFLRRHPRDRELRFLLATLDVALGNSGNAIKELHTVLTEAPNNVEARYVLAVVLRDEVGDVEAADSEFREYLRLAPGGTHAEEAQGSLLTRVP
jgi:Flp pilus assembly protein TadD